MKVAFASCSSITRRWQDKQPIWDIIRRQNPDLLLLLGDNVYIGDDGYDPAPIETKASILEEKYKLQTEEPHFKKLLDEVHYLAVWDNHDFGLPGKKYRSEDATVKRYGYDVTNQHRRIVRGLFNKYLKYGSLKPWSEHVYCSYTHEEESGKKIKFIMVDVRSWQQNPNIENAQLLDLEQRRWLRQELLSGDADINVICSGVPYTAGSAGWKAHENWFKEFNDLAAQTSKPLFLGGNIHGNKFLMHEVSKDPITDLPPGVLTARSQNMFEVVSSGVGQNFDSGDNDDEDDNGPDYDKPLAGRPRNNYGIIDFTETIVKVTLYGQHMKDIHYAEIDRNKWTLKTYHCVHELPLPVGSLVSI